VRRPSLPVRMILKVNASSEDLPRSAIVPLGLLRVESMLNPCWIELSDRLRLGE
jgi:hypothetical protein